MENQIDHGAAAPENSKTVFPKVEYLLMGEGRGKRQLKAFENNVDPAFDPITAALRQMHDNFASEPIPDDFMLLLDQIDARISASKKAS